MKELNIVLDSALKEREAEILRMIKLRKNWCLESREWFFIHICSFLVGVVVGLCVAMTLLGLEPYPSVWIAMTCGAVGLALSIARRESIPTTEDIRRLKIMQELDIQRMYRVICSMDLERGKYWISESPY